MTLRKRTLLIIGLTLAGLFIALYLALSKVLLAGFAQVEDQTARRNAQRALEAFNREVINLETTTGDWAAWTETYNFVQGRNPQYIEDNLLDVTFSNLQLNLMLFVDASGQIVYGKAFDLQNNLEVPLSQSLLNQFAADHLLLQHTHLHSVISGFILLPENPMLVGSRPIVTNDYQGPIQGTLIMGRYLNNNVVEQLANVTRFSLRVHRLDDPQQAAALPPNLLSQPDAIVIEPLSSEDLAGFVALRDVHGQPGLALQVNMTRPVYAQSQLSLRALIISLLAVGLVFVMLTLILLERLVLARVARLHAGVAEIGAGGDLSQRLSLPGSDELSNLAQAINRMLQDLQNALAREKQLRYEVHQLRIEIDQVKKERQVSEITDSDFFQDLQQKAHKLRQERQLKMQQSGLSPENVEPSHESETPE